MPRKHSYEFVKHTIESQNYSLLSTEYTNSQTNLLIKCPKDHEFEMRFNGFKNGQRCPFCQGKRLPTIEYIRKLCGERNIELLSTEISGYKDKLRMMCPEGHKFEQCWNNFQQGHGCFKCAKTTKKTKEEIIQLIENKGYSILNIENYENVHSKIKLKCGKDHVFETVCYSILKGHGCPECAGLKKKTFEEVKIFIEKLGHILLSTEYKNHRSPMSIKCEEGHIFEKCFHDIKQNVGCPVCSRNRSVGEREVAQFVTENYFGEIITNDREILTNPHTNRWLELDIWMPQMNKAIEYGAKWFHEENADVATRDNIKKQLLIDKGILLLSIDDRLWNKDKVNQKLKIISFIS